MAVTFAVFKFTNRSPRPPEVSLSAIDRNLASLIETSRTAVVSAPKSAAAWGRLGQCLHAAEFFVEATVCYSNATHLDPRDARWHYLLGVLELQDHPESALQHLARATDLTAGQSDAPRYALARALVERSRYDEAKAHLDLLLASNPEHAAARVELARLFIARNQFKEAMEQLQAPMNHPLTRRRSLLLAAQVAQRNKQADLAAQLSRTAQSVPLAPDWPDTFLKEVQSLRVDRAKLADGANMLIQQQRLAEAEAALAKLLNTFPNDPEGLLLLGRLRYLEKNCAGAETALRRYLELQPGALNGLIQLGIALMCQEKWTNAAQVFEQALAAKPDFTSAHHNLGICRSHMGDSTGAIKAFQDALRSTPGDVNVLFALAEELANTGDVKEAISCVRRIEALAPKDQRLLVARKHLKME
jgi:tetratricopeptide (TPR) repeat protein